MPLIVLEASTRTADAAESEHYDDSLDQSSETDTSLTMTPPRGGGVADDDEITDKAVTTFGDLVPEPPATPDSYFEEEKEEPK